MHLNAHDDMMISLPLSLDILDIYVHISRISKEREREKERERQKICL